MASKRITPPKTRPSFIKNSTDTFQERYFEVAKECEKKSYDSKCKSRLPNRSPYIKGKEMGRGAHFSPRFQDFIESGGVARWKNCVAMSIRLTDLRDIESKNGDGTFKADFFLDTAFWVPTFEREHFDDIHNLGTFSQFEPLLEFPEVDVEAGNLKWISRSYEFSRNSNSRHHEVQLGEIHETVVNSGLAALRLAVLGRGAGRNEKVRVSDRGAHWRFLWRCCVSDEELLEMEDMSKDARNAIQPNLGKPMRCNQRLRALFKKMDEDRKTFLPTHAEGIAFVTYEISCIHRCEFQLHEFPFDMHNLNIIVRCSKKDHDPMDRIIIPIAHDNCFTVSSRVKSLMEYHVAGRLNWEVTKEPVSYGGYHRLNAAVTVRRKPAYYVRNYVIIIFMLTSSTFTSFLARPDDLDSRSGIVFTVLLSVVAFKYSGATTMPQVSYATILDAYILLNFYMVLMVGTVVFAFSMVCSMGGTNDEDNLERVQKDLICSRHPGDGYGLDFLPKYDPVVETICGLCFFGVWLGLNAWYWWSVWERIELNKTIISDVSIGWVKFKLEAGAIEGQFPIEKFVKRKEEGKASKATCWDGLLSKFYGPTAAQQTASPHRSTISSLVKVPTENVAGSRKKSTDFFQTVVEFVAQEKAKHKAATTIQSMVRRRKVQSEHHQHYKEIYANRKGSTKDSLVETAM